MVTLPVQLLWHQHDFGGSDSDVLEALLPLLPTPVSEAIGVAGGKASARSVRIRYTSHAWETQLIVSSRGSGDAERESG